MSRKRARFGPILVLVLAGTGLLILRAPVGSILAAAPEEEAKEAGKGVDEKKPARDPAIGGLLDADASTTGKIAGAVILKGDLPEMKPHTVKADHKDRRVCGHTIPYERHVIGDKKEVANVVISLVMEAPKRPEPRTIELTNLQCRFVPHVQATTVRSKLNVTSRDAGVLHTALGLIADNFNIAIPNTKTVVSRTLKRPGWLLVKCATHDWMQAHIHIFQHDFFAVTGKDGKFRIEGIPPGEYELQVWHEGLHLKGNADPGAQKIKGVKIEAGKTTDLAVELEIYK